MCVCRSSKYMLLVSSEQECSWVWYQVVTDSICVLFECEIFNIAYNVGELEGTYCCMCNFLNDTSWIDWGIHAVPHLMPPSNCGMLSKVHSCSAWLITGNTIWIPFFSSFDLVCISSICYSWLYLVFLLHKQLTLSCANSCKICNWGALSLLPCLESYDPFVWLNFVCMMAVNLCIQWHSVLMEST